MTRKMQQLWLERRLAVLGLQKVKETSEQNDVRARPGSGCFRVLVFRLQNRDTTF